MPADRPRGVRRRVVADGRRGRGVHDGGAGRGPRRDVLRAARLIVRRLRLLSRDRGGRPPVSGVRDASRRSRRGLLLPIGATRRARPSPKRGNLARADRLNPRHRGARRPIPSAGVPHGARRRPRSVGREPGIAALSVDFSTLKLRRDSRVSEFFRAFSRIPRDRGAKRAGNNAS